MRNAKLAGRAGLFALPKKISCARTGYSQFRCFLVVGATATMIQYAILHFMVVADLAGPIGSSTVGYTLSAIFNYWANHKVTFQSDQAHHVALPRFLAVVIVGLALNAVLVGIGTKVVGLHHLSAQVFATIAVLAFNFIANRHWAFAGRLID